MVEADRAARRIVPHCRPPEVTARRVGFKVETSSYLEIMGLDCNYLRQMLWQPILLRNPGYIQDHNSIVLRKSGMVQDLFQLLLLQKLILLFLEPAYIPLYGIDPFLHLYIRLHILV